MKKKFIYAIVILFIAGITGCSKLEDFGDTNVNPSATTDPIIGALLTNAQSNLGTYASMTRPGLYGQYFSETQYTENSLYSTPQLPFAGEYAGVLNDFQNIINQGKSKNMSTIAKILKQYVFWKITDRWGDVPYTEALTVGVLQPKYDKQEDIYKGMISALKAAVGEFDGSIITGDVVNNGSVDAWKRAANSMRMLMAIQLSKRFPAASGYAATEFKAALAESSGYISTNAQNFIVAYPGGNYKSNWWRVYDGRKDFAESKTMTDLMSSLGDTRQNSFGGSSEVAGSTTTSNIGVPYGLVRANAEAFTGANPGWARILRGDYRNENSPVILISAAQVALARAEAADYGWTTEPLATVYAQGIGLSFQQWGSTMPASYLTQGGVALTAAPGSGGNLKNITIQRYIASYPDGLMSWNIWRKTGFPALTPAPGATNTSKQIPRRYTYATAEYSSNAVNVKAAVAALPGGDTQDSKIWWDQ
ncbi:SusD/RagB family nutrient-binding outer membrane lipoprotein [Daejeonella sp.]|uniref:SusD/RagB family nutrient-binding outer membrane lipoprotein n=1 Tax=Daejeonella sp. TaxID=2805397 RepID=UPI0030C22333